MKKIRQLITATLLLSVLLIIPACSTLLQNKAPQPSSKYQSEWCKTRYPIVFIHGIALKDKTLFTSYWGKIPQQLEALGASSYFGGQAAYKTNKLNAEYIAKRIDLILAKHNTDKVNIIAHSKGGIEARYLISVLGYESKVASLTTICTPHRGSSIADIIISKTENNRPLQDFIILTAAMQALYMGNLEADPYNSGAQLTTANMMQFNKEVPDSPQVYYQSYSARIREAYPDNILKKAAAILEQYEGENDGLVSVQSAIWGDYKGIILEDDAKGLSHGDVIDMFPRSKQERYKIYDFYIQLVHDLKLRGY